jgi:ammonia channel protein AmtB
MDKEGFEALITLIIVIVCMVVVPLWATREDEKDGIDYP